MKKWQRLLDTYDIGQLNRMLADYIQKHNTTVHFATVILDKKLYDIPMEFTGSTVEIRYRPGKPGSAFILQKTSAFL